jgi:threonine dehydratase
MPSISTPSKIDATRGYGAEIIFSGSTAAERDAVKEEVKKRTGAIFIPPDSHPDIILGQGTTALELEAQVQEMISNDETLSVHHRSTNKEHSSGFHLGPSSSMQACHLLDAVITPLGGGGLLSGVATALHGTRTLVFGSEPSFQGADDGRRSLETGVRITHVSSLTIADGLRTHVKEIPWGIISDREKVRGVYAVSEAQILSAMKLVLERMKIVVEPSAVVGLAVCLYNEDFRALVEAEGEEEGWDVGVVLSGGNTSVDAIAKMFDGAVERAERVQGKVGVDGERVADDVPG